MTLESLVLKQNMLSFFQLRRLKVKVIGGMSYKAHRSNHCVTERDGIAHVVFGEESCQKVLGVFRDLICTGGGLY